MKAGFLRLGGIKKSYSQQLLIVGDAAGMIDPMTGEGIHHAMDGGRIAAKWLAEAVAKGNYSQEVFEGYQKEWEHAFGHDFKWSMSICQLLYRYPIMIDAAAAAVARKGDQFLARWADIMTGKLSLFSSKKTITTNK
jgi:flavin-dependent dehydrogenase